MTLADAIERARNPEGAVAVEITEWWWHISTSPLMGPTYTVCAPGFVSVRYLTQLGEHGAGRPPHWTDGHEAELSRQRAVEAK